MQEGAKHTGNQS